MNNILNDMNNCQTTTLTITLPSTVAQSLFIMIDAYNRFNRFNRFT